MTGGGRGQWHQTQPSVHGRQWLMETFSLELPLMNLSVTLTEVSAEQGGQKSDVKSLKTQLEETEEECVDDSFMKFDYKVEGRIRAVDRRGLGFGYLFSYEKAKR